MKFLFDSSLAIKQSDSFNLTFEIKSFFPPKESQKILLKDVSIDWNFFRNIHQGNNTLIFDSDTATIPLGKYTPSELAAELQTQLNISCVFGGTTWTVVYDSKFFRFTITQSGVFYSVLSSSSLSLEVFGLAPGVYASIISSSFVPSFGQPRSLNFITNLDQQAQSVYNNTYCTFTLPLKLEHDGKIKFKNEEEIRLYTQNNSRVSSLHVMVVDERNRMVKYIGDWGFSLECI